ncbi:MAG: manganese efflux pump MntP family protein [Myxococcales bacterium]
MDWLSLLAVAFALAMDAFAVAMVSGLTVSPLTKGHVLRLSGAFGLFQALMPILGWAAGNAVHSYISAFDHWVAFGLLAFVGGKMVWEGLHHDEEEKPSRGDPTRGWQLLILSIATSIDALAVGLSLAMVGSTIALPALVIGVVAAGMTAVGVLLGRRVGALWGQRVEIMGGAVLVIIGVKILAEHALA